MTSVTPPPIPDTDLPVAPAPKRARSSEHVHGTSKEEDPAIDHKLGAVVLIEVTSTSPDFVKPWKMHSQRTCKGSGFVIEGQRIMTNFHVVQDAIDVRLRKHGMSRRWRGKVVAVGPDVDLALLEVHEEELSKGESFWTGVSPVTWQSTLPQLQSAVHVCGFPTGGTTISVTQGVVSRIDCKNYRVGPAMRSTRAACWCCRSTLPSTRATVAARRSPRTGRSSASPSNHLGGTRMASAI
jgi:S1-C subfamily serine protease